MSCLLIRFPGFSPVSLSLSSLHSTFRTLGVRRLWWVGDRIHIVEFLAPGFLSRGACSSLYGLSLSFWLSWFSCVCLCGGESAHLLWAAQAVAYPGLLYPLSILHPFSKSPIPSQTFFCSHRYIYIKKVSVFVTIILAESLKGKGINMWVQSVIFPWNPTGY